MKCPICNFDISDSYLPTEPDLGIFVGDFYCDTCDLVVEEDDDDSPELDLP